MQLYIRYTSIKIDLHLSRMFQNAKRNCRKVSLTKFKLFSH